MAWNPDERATVTALGLAASRTLESAREDRLVHDPYAWALFEAAGVELPVPLAWPAAGEPVDPTAALHLHGSLYIGVRTRHYDDVVGDAAVDQVVLLGAGLDTRAQRLGLPAGLRLFEVDQPGVLAFKAEVLDGLGVRASCHLATVGVDLAGPWTQALRDAGFDAARPAVWIAEGLLAYLDAGARADLLNAIDGLSAPGSVLALDRLAGDPAANGTASRLADRSGFAMDDLLAGGATDDLAALLAARGWQVDEHSATAVAARYGRDLADPFAASASTAAEPPWLDTVFLTARRGEGA